jgi:ketose-bisphosphate aldolase
MIKTLNELFAEAKAGKWAIGHFNFSTADQLRAIVEAAAELKMPVMAATSEGEADFIGREQAVALVQSYRKEGYEVFLNADHHKSWETVKAAIDAGYDSVLIDASKLPFEENIALTKKVVDYAREAAASGGREIPVEGELGYLRGSSEIQKKIEISADDYTKPEEAKKFVAQTGVDRLAIVFGNIHGIVTEQEERLDMETLKNIAAAVPETVLVLHGASGLRDEEVREAIKNGIANVHINTELRVAYHEALESELQKEPEQTTPYKFLAPSYEATKEIVLKKNKLFKNL